MNNDILFDIYAKLFARNSFIKFNKFLFNLSLRGMGILNYKNDELSGEKWFLENYFKDKDHGNVVFDVGANQGNYTKLLIRSCPSLSIYSFEPHPITFKKLINESREYQFTPLNIGLSDTIGTIELYDYKNKTGSSHASVYKEVFQKIHQENCIKYEVEFSTIDCFCDKKNITDISLLKIDTEGHEYKVLKGAKKMLAAKRIQAIHFEFNEMNVISKIFLNDFISLLPNFSFYRMLPHGLAPISNFRLCHLEIFAYQNIVAIKNK